MSVIDTWLLETQKQLKRKQNELKLLKEETASVEKRLDAYRDVVEQYDNFPENIRRMQKEIERMQREIERKNSIMIEAQQQDLQEKRGDEMEILMEKLTAIIEERKEKERTLIRLMESKEKANNSKA